jgi:hypothetical protein
LTQGKAKAARLLSLFPPVGRVLVLGLVVGLGIEIKSVIQWDKVVVYCISVVVVSNEAP